MKDTGNSNAPEDDFIHAMNEVVKYFLTSVANGKIPIVTVPAAYSCHNGKVIYRHDSIPSEYLRIFTNGFN